MHVSFQKEAFFKLDAEKKRIILENSKLKDELSLQDIGIANLTLRCAKDKDRIKKINVEASLALANVFICYICVVVI